MSLSRFEQFSQRPLKQRAGAAGAVLAAFLLARAGIKYYESAKAKRAKPGIAVGAATARLGNVPVYLNGLGTVTAYYTDNVQAQVSGQLMSVNFKEGQFVHKGDVLAQIDPRPYQAQFEQAQGALAKDEALLADARLDLARYKRLLAQNAVPSQTYDTQIATVGQDEGNVVSDKAAVETARLNLVYSRITSLIDGRVGLRLVDPGNMVYASGTNGATGLFVITQMQPITVVFTLPEDDIPKLMRKYQGGVRLPVEAYNRDGSQKLATGYLLALDSQINANTGTLNLKAVFDNKDWALFPNEFVNVKLLLEMENNQVIVPAAAVQSGAQGSFVYVVKPDSTVEARNVNVGITEGNDVSISGGLADGEIVVIDGIDNIQPGSKVSVSQAGNGASVSSGQEPPQDKSSSMLPAVPVISGAASKRSSRRGVKGHRQR